MTVGVAMAVAVGAAVAVAVGAAVAVTAVVIELVEDIFLKVK